MMSIKVIGTLGSYRQDIYALKQSLSSGKVKFAI